MYTGPTPDVYFHAEDEMLPIVLQGKLTELLIFAAPKIYSKYAQIGKDNKPTLYMRLLKALYGRLRSALLFYRKLVADLKNMCFVTNPDSMCMANRMVKGKQQTVCWHVDDPKLPGEHMGDQASSKDMW